MLISSRFVIPAVLTAFAGTTAASVTDDLPQFTQNSNFPVRLQFDNGQNEPPSYRTIDGGVFTNMDGDPELEFVVKLNQFLFAINPDGTFVAPFPIPTFFTDTAVSPVALGDVDGDGVEEIVVQRHNGGSVGEVRVFEKNGASLSGFPINGVGGLGGAGKGPSLANIDGIPGDEIITVTQVFEEFPPDSGSFSWIAKLNAITLSGDQVPGYPVALIVGEFPTASVVAIGDIDGDDVDELVATTAKNLFALEVDGSVVPGFPVNIDTSPASFQFEATHMFSSFGAPSLVDLDFDGDLEICIATSPDTFDSDPVQTPPAVHVFSYDSDAQSVAPYPGWPQQLPTTRLTALRSPVAVADIDGDYSYEIIMQDSSGQLDPDTQELLRENVLMVWEHDGTPQDGFPVLDVFGSGGIMFRVANLDLDPELEIITGINRAGLPNMIYNSDGTRDIILPTIVDNGIGDPVDELSIFDGWGSPEFVDYDLDGNLDVMWHVMRETDSPDDPQSENNLTGTFRLFDSDTIPYRGGASAPVATYGYNYQRTFAVPPISGPVCVADFNSDGPIDSGDVDLFLTALDGNSPFTDLNGDQSSDAIDFFLFLDQLVQGCGD